MHRFIGAAVLTLTSLVTIASAQTEITKIVDLGELKEFFAIVKAEQSFDNMRGGSIYLLVEAKKDVDTSQLHYKAGFFDMDDQVLFASEVRFKAELPMKAKERVGIEITAGRDDRPFKKIALRMTKKPAEKSDK